MSELTKAVEEAGLNSPRAKAMLVGTAKDIMKRMDSNLRRMGVSPYDPKGSGTGQMKRSVHWTVFNATNGDEAIIQFYVQNVASFVELAVQGMRNPRTGKYMKGWGVKQGGLPSGIPGTNYGAIHVGRTTSSGAVLKRKAKPFLAGEMRVHGRMLFDRLVKDYGYVGNMLLASSIVPNITGYVRGTTGGFIQSSNGGLATTPITEKETFERKKGEYSVTHQMKIGDLRMIIKRQGFDITDFD